MSDAPALRFEGVGLILGQARVLDEVSFTLPAGGALAIVGDSGSGKSALVRLAGALALPTDGRVTILGRNSTLAGNATRLRVGMTLQGGSLFDELGIDDNLKLGAGVTSAAGWRALAPRVDRLLYEFGLEELADAPVGMLSVGARRQLEVVRALLRDPALLILDEPFEGAAAQVAAMAAAIRRSLRRRGGALLLVTQDPALAAAMADDRLALHHGRLAQQAEDTSRPPATSPAIAVASAATPA